MFVTFHSTASPDVLMQKDLAQYLLGIVGKRLDIRGVIMHDELPTAIGRLEAAISADKKTDEVMDSLQPRFRDNHHVEHHGGLSQRAWPFLGMLRDAEKQQADILWGL